MLASVYKANMTCRSGLSPIVASMSSRISTSVPYTQLGLTTEEVQLLRAGQLDNVVDKTVDKIAKFHDIRRQVDELALDLKPITHIRDIVHEFRHKAEQLESVAPIPSMHAEFAESLSEATQAAR